jgi:heterodisulfide reductase subunit B
VKFALYLGCMVQSEQYNYEASVRATLPKLGVELLEIDGASCCGYPPFSSINEFAWLYSSARNMALAEELGFDMLTLCNGCHLSFVETKHILKEHPNRFSKVNSKLAEEGLRYTGNVKLIHTFDLLHDIIGLEKIKSAVVNPLSDLKLATHPGCHAIRPNRLGRPDDPENPRKLDELVECLGAKLLDYPEKIDCCGSNLAFTSGKTVLDIAGEKLKALKSYGVDGLVTTCPFCFKVYDNRQKAIQSQSSQPLELPVFYYTQLLGLSMGLRPLQLGIELNMSPVDEFLKKIGDII